MSEAFYFTDPEGNGIELYRDRSRDQWRWDDGYVRMASLRLDPHAFLDEHLTEAAAAQPGAAPVVVGHVHLQVGDLAAARHFYVDALGFEVTAQVPGALFVAAGGYHHHLGLNTWESRGGSPPPRGTTGLFHVAVRYPDRRTLADALRRLVDANWPIDGATDHGVSEAIYLRDPDGNGIELYYDRPREAWFDAQGKPIIKAEPFDPRDLLAELSRAS